MQALLRFQQPALGLFQLVLQPLPIVLEALNQSRSFFHPLGEQVEIGLHHHGGFGHRSLKRAPQASASADTIRPWTLATSDSVSVRSGCWNRRA